LSALDFDLPYFQGQELAFRLLVVAYAGTQNKLIKFIKNLKLEYLQMRKFSIWQQETGLLLSSSTRVRNHVWFW